MAESNGLRLSHSAVEDYASCGEKYRLRRVAKVPEIPGWALVGGSAFHSVTEHLDLLDFGIDSGGTASFEEAFLLEMDKRIQETGSLPDKWSVSGRATKEFPNKEDKDFWLKTGPQWVGWYRSFLRNSPWQVWIMPDSEPAVELELEWTIGDIPVKGYVDRIYEHSTTGALCIVDLKTGRMEPGPKQLVLYRSGLRALWEAQEWPGNPPGLGAFYMARNGLMTSPFDVTSLDDGRLEYEYAAAGRGIQAEVFLPNKSMLCNYCAVRDYCREYDGLQYEQELPYNKVA